MSTYYQFRCPECREMGGFFSRQMWGWGNCEIFENFKFMVAHAHCGQLEILGEHDAAYFNHGEELRWLERLNSDEDLLDDVWPHADEWEWVKESWEGSHARFRAEAARKLERERKWFPEGGEA